MKAVQIVTPHEMRVVDIDKPTVGAGEVLVKIKYVGFCGSDLNTFLGRNPMVKMPVIPGHEVGAVIEETGEGVGPELKKRDGSDTQSLYQLWQMRIVPKRTRERLRAQ
jgi:D-arabinose 1-dehydrogenase-like Zn-dependent alcohol dehydrogenase